MTTTVTGWLKALPKALPKMRVLSLCAGIGGLDLACEMTGRMVVVGQVEIDDFCNRVLAHHWPDVCRMRDIREGVGDEFGAIDLLCAGFPCQPVSHAGKRRGAADDRWLWEEVDRIIRCARPAWVLLENVPGLISLGLDSVLGDLDAAGYEAWPVVFPAAAVGAPHERERIFIVGCHLSVSCATVADSEGGSRRGAARGNRGLALAGGVPLADSRGGQWQRSVRLSRGRHSVSWQGCGGSVDGCGADGVRDVADADRHGGRWPERADAGDVAGATGAHTDREGHPQWATAQCGGTDGAWARDVAGLADASSAGLQRQGTGRSVGEPGQAQPLLGGDADGISARLEGHSGWPALPGGAQHQYEPPRTITERQPHRADRLKALGNAVVCWQALPVAEGIATAWLMTLSTLSGEDQRVVGGVTGGGAR